MTATSFLVEGLEAEVAAIREENFRPAIGTDPAWQGMLYACDRILRRARELTTEEALLTPEQWGRRQHPPVSAQSVRKWIRRGELQAVPGTRGRLVPASATRAPVAP